MKILKISFLVLLFIGFTSGQAQSQSSDFQTVQNFKKEYDRLKGQIASVTEVSVLDSLKSEIRKFEQSYLDNRVLLNNALYPDSFDGKFDELKTGLNMNQARLLIIDNQDEQIAQLQDELRSYKIELDRFATTTDSLEKLIASSRRSERNLEALVARYRDNIKKRDEFIVNIMDSLLIAHNELSVQDSTEIGNQQSGAIISSDENPLNIIKMIAEENLNTLKANPDYLSVEDYLRLYTLQTKVEGMWNSIGSDLVALYADNKDDEWTSTIDSTLYRWKSSASRNMWKSLMIYAENNNMDLEAFDDNESFYIALDSFIQEAKRSSEGMIPGNSEFVNFEQFDQFWTTKIKDEWNTYIQEGGLLTVSQINNIDKELISWRDDAIPGSIWLPFIIGLLVISVTFLAVVYIRK
ncbi:hypothetical protein AB2B38_001425 [Balneola sp. MJW-20]|uniref:hypothetical protein n=1 Tax=Gracilimonas aurantiaca TaxID=3234185 RepID=UPI0034676F84